VLLRTEWDWGAGIARSLEERDYGGNSHDCSTASVGEHDRAANKLLQESLGDAVQTAYRESIEQLDRQSAQAVIENDAKLKPR